jgi:hypothetical protein
MLWNGIHKDTEDKEDLRTTDDKQLKKNKARVEK